MAKLADRDALPLVVIAHEDPGTADALRHAVEAGAGWRAVVATARPEGLAAAVAAAGRGDATVAIVGCGRLRELPAAYDTPVLAVGDDRHIDDLRAALDAGAKGFITWPDAAADLAGELARLAEEPRGPAPAAQPSTLVAVAGVQGGAGTTTLAAHCAAAWARWGPRPVLLADLAGGLAFRLDLGSDVRSWATLAPLAGGLAGGLDGELLTGLVTSYWADLAVLPLPGLPDGTVEPPPPPELVAAVLQAAALTYRVVVVDLPPQPSPAGEVVLAQADVILAVARPDSAGLNALETACDTWSGEDAPPRTKPTRERVGLVVSGVSARSPLARRQIETRLGGKLWGTIPASPDELTAAAEDGLLLLNQPEQPAVTAMLTLAHRVLPFTAEAVTR